MRDITKISSGEKFKTKELVLGALTHLFVGFCSFLSARAVVIRSLLPFGISFLAGSSLTYTPAAALGVFLGYFIPAVQNSGFKYLAVMFAVLSIKLLLSGYKRLISSEIFLSFITFLSLMLISAAAVKTTGGSIIDALAESVMAAIGTFFVCRTFKTFKKAQAGLSADELSALLLVINILTLSLAGVTVFNISLGRILCVCLLLAASKYGGILAGAISGTAVAFTLILGGISGNVAVLFAVAGLFCGIFSTLGKYAQVFTLLLLSIIGAVVTRDLNLMPLIITESVLGAVIYMVLPRSVGVFLGKIFSVYPKVSVPTGIKKSVAMRLNLASGALRDVSTTVENVSRELSRINSPDFTTVIGSIEGDACAGCKLRIHCWEMKREETVNAILEMTKAVKSGAKTPEAAAPEEFKLRCLRQESVGSAVHTRYTDYALKIAAENRIDEVRSVVSDQFDGISSMLSELAEDLETQERFDNTPAENAAAALKNIDIHIEECSSKTDKKGRITVELRLKKSPDLVINKAQVMRLCSLACERDFAVPLVTKSGNDIYITLNERTRIAVDFGVCQSSANGNSMCGDAYKAFTDSKGNFVMILSDGMGTGGRAAVDGAMASGLMARLLKAGFGYDCSLKILNSSMLFKSTDESLATVDIASVDLYTGTTELYKAGAAPTIVRRSGKTGKAESSSLPAGILRNIGFDKASLRCRVGDIVLMLSDGATADGTDWIRRELEAWDDGTAENLAEHLCSLARRRQIEKRQDDITVMCAILNNA